VMDIPGLWAPPTLNFCLRQARTRGNVHLAERFHTIIEQEKARADRNAHHFSLVLFQISKARQNILQVRYLIHLLANRIRWTDEVGWFDTGRLGVVLPDTSAVGAHRLADSICEAVAAKTSAPEYTVHTYPSASFPNGNGHSSQLSFTDILPQWEPLLSQGQDLRSGEFGTRQPHSDIRSNDMTWAEELEPFFFQPTQIWKRAFDILGSIVAIIALSPLFLFVSVLIKTVSKGPVFFKQQRVGYMGKTFTMWKFRTLKVNADAARHRMYVTKLINGASQNGTAKDAPMTKLDNHDERIPFGQTLRKMCIDELPQLLNVLRGEMSLVGPRPALMYEVEEYLPWHFRRFDVLPGMTGLWQVSGKNRLTFNEMVRLDIQYIRQQSFWLDIKILLRTPFAIVSQVTDALQGKQVLSDDAVEKWLTLQ